MLKEAQIDRYARHILLREVGGVGQERLLASSISIEGLDAGGWLVSWLALAGVGTLFLDDPGPVGPAELAPLLSAGDLGRPRGEALAAAVPGFNGDVRVVVGRGEAASLRIRAGLPPGGVAGAALWYAALGDDAVVVPPGARLCTACLEPQAGRAELLPAAREASAASASLPAAPAASLPAATAALLQADAAGSLAATAASLPAATAASLAGSVAGSEALLHLLGRSGRLAVHFRRGEKVVCTHGI